ncbi:MULTISPECIES: DUF2188 domain-containing protein [Rhizobium]|uniref:DUF2188 domain-containing protein n=1 Tax=Rhizobium laguerreae TaxID=1076926 RepID=A0A7Y2W5Y7_9HYPH|nr:MULTISPECIES: DUF2188 domain-containing protein [Rhizobium]MBY5368737.1 DUF2188 domain-containing protein [Rhizobium leguminosarum]MBY5451731.1 DUF2188 domain-containing protein [Rhizobium leguminosarum]NNG72802.1 DUF2188 domain-containing protein [Rhizobium laguerreae]NNH56830.1 DUF2188 domain-containing protein [Rhizobium laguerreae]NNH64684.1 DUF2188 domain-containing protein [Rhizobium laguerreae]
MADITYQVVPHDNGWAYKLGDTLSETYATADEAIVHAKDAASRQKIGDGDALLAYPSPDGGWEVLPIDTDKSGSRL